MGLKFKLASVVVIIFKNVVAHLFKFLGGSRANKEE